ASRAPPSSMLRTAATTSSLAKGLVMKPSALRSIAALRSYCCPRAVRMRTDVEQSSSSERRVLRTSKPPILGSMMSSSTRRGRDRGLAVTRDADLPAAACQDELERLQYGGLILDDQNIGHLSPPMASKAIAPAALTSRNRPHQ